MANGETRARHIYIIGAQCTGKTTLVNALEAELASLTDAQKRRLISRPTFIREVARTVLKEKQFRREDITTSPARALQLQQHILDAQLSAEQAIPTHTDPSAWYICDRSGLDPIVYARVFVGEDAAERMLATEAWKELEGRMKEGIVFLCEAGSSWLVDDGIRLMPTGLEEWMYVDMAFRELLAVRQIGYMIIPKDLASLAERVRVVREQIILRENESQMDATDALTR
ncbi:hypothetical protein N0V90_012071 [Kalmusia sp. IMI 367209]|nr:hypothetical protein N0V90_012071 [Kalmusia sp. IMI 367209]